MTREFTEAQRASIALVNMTAAVDNLLTVIYSADSKPTLPAPGAYPMDLHINALTAHVNYAVAQYSALQSDTAQRVIDDRNDEIEDLEYDAAEQRLKDLMSKAFGGLGSPTGRFSFGAPFGKEAGADLFEAIFGTRPAAPTETPAGDAAVEEPVPEGVFWDETTVSFRDAEGTNMDGDGYAFFDKWFARSNDFPLYVHRAAPNPDAPAQAAVEGGDLPGHVDVGVSER